MDYGVERIYHPHDGMELGLEAMIRDLIERTVAPRRRATVPPSEPSLRRRYRRNDFSDRRGRFRRCRT